MTEEELNRVFNDENMEALGMKKNISELFPGRKSKGNAGRPPKFGKAMTDAERQKARRDRVKAMKQTPEYQMEQVENKKVSEAKETALRAMSSFFGQFRAKEENLLKSNPPEHDSEVHIFADVAKMLMNHFGKDGLRILMSYPDFALSYRKHISPQSD